MYLQLLNKLYFNSIVYYSRKVNSSTTLQFPVKLKVIPPQEKGLLVLEEVLACCMQWMSLLQMLQGAILSVP